jgi:chemotaxis protein CheD
MGIRKATLSLASIQSTRMVMPGEHAVLRQPGILGTLLGSCVAACFWDVRLKIGGMNHFMLPQAPDIGSPTGAPARYGLYAMEVLINDMLMAGCKRENLSVKVFGGANMTQTNNLNHVGQRNADFVLNFLQKDGWVAKASDLGGVHSRRIYFDTFNGDIRRMKVPRHDETTLVQQEVAYQEKLSRDPVAGDVTFF